MPFPDVVDPPGFLVRVQVPVFGNPFNTTLPVPTLQVGWVIVPIIGEAGDPGEASITTLADCAEAQPSLFVTV